MVSVLGSSTASRVVSLLTIPPAENKYATLKARLLKTFQLSDAERASRLFSLQGLGDSKPSELMDRMLDLLGEHRPDFLFVQLFLWQLQVRAALANTTTTNCRALAEEADKLFLAGQHHGMAAAALTLDLPPSHSAAWGPAPLSGDAALTAAATASSRRRPETNLCFYHAKYGAKARRCHSPCSFGGLDILADGFGPPLEAANGSSIRTYGTRHVELCFSGQRFTWDFITAKVAVPLLGAEFLCAYGLLVDVKNCRLIDATTFCSYPCALSSLDSARLSSVLSPTGDFLRLLAEFPTLTQPTFSSTAVKHGVEHHIATTGQKIVRQGEHTRKSGRVPIKNI